MDSVEPAAGAVPAAPPPPAPWITTQRLAPWWHTILLVAFVLLMSASSSSRMDVMVAKHGRIALYTPTLILEWVMVGYVAWGIRKSGVTLREIIGGRWNSPEDALLDVALSFGVWLAIMLMLAGLAWAMGLTEAAKVQQAKQQIGAMLPQSGLEMAFFALLSATAGFCEEVIFRGYLLRQFSAAFGAVWMGVAAQALVFGLSHGYEGWERMILIALEGVVLAVVAMWRRSLRPSMGAHFTQDFVSGMLGRVAMKTLK